MKKIVALILAFILTLALVACGTSPEGETIKTYGYVSYVESDGFVAYINDIGLVFVKYSGANRKIDAFDTVIIEYYEDDLVEKSGIYVNNSGEMESYTHKIKKVKEARPADPANDELVFG